jgi:hypothetical protein
MGDTAWMELARCVPDECWTDPDPSTPSLRWMQQICGECPVTRECAAYALDAHLEGGVFAGVLIPTRDGAKHTRRARAVDRARDALRRVVAA